MPKTSPQLEWCVVRLGEDMNWWVDEISDSIHWDVDGLSIIDPRQIAYIIDLIDPLHEYGFDPDLFESAFYTFRIGRNVGDGRVKLQRTNESLLDTEDKLFALPDILDEETGPYADLVDHLVKLRVKLLNDTFDFEQKLTADELEEEIRDEQNNSFLEGRSVHLFQELVSILEYVPAGWEKDDDSDESDKADSDDEAAAFPDIEDEEEEQVALNEDETMRWDDEEDDSEETEEDDFLSEDDEEEGEGENLDDLDDEEEGDEEIEEAPPKRKSRKRS